MEFSVAGNALAVLLTCAAIALLVIGFLGTFVPVLPGAPLAWGGLLCAYFCQWNHISVTCLIITAVVAVVVSILDNFMGPIMTSKCGGSKAGTWGATIGLVVGLFTGPWGIILGPFVGALIGELINDSSDFKKCLKSAGGAFLGFLLGTGMKMVAVAAFVWVYVASLFVK